MARPARGSFVNRSGALLFAGYAVATFLAFPHPLGDFVLDLGLVMAWASPLLLLLAIRGLAPGRAAWGAFLAFPQPVGGRVIDLGWLLGWASPALLILSLRGLGPKAAARVCCS